MALKIIFMGTPEFAVPCLSEILGSGHDVVAVYTQPPRPAGRGMDLKKSPVHGFAEHAGLKVLTPKSLKTESAQQDYRAHQADLAVVVAYGLLLPKAILEATPLGAVNVHGSALPRWRGAAPIQRAIMAGDQETAVMIMQMEEGLDTGPILLSDHMAIGPDMTAGELHDQMMIRGADLLVRALAAMERGSLEALPQSDEGVTYAKKILKTETEINWHHPAPKVHNHIRGLSPFPGAWFEAEIINVQTGQGKSERIKVLSSCLSDLEGQPGEVLGDQLTIGCAEGSVQLLQVQRAGKKPMAAEAFLNGLTGVLRITALSK